jgi:hypothetical protein
MSTLSGAVLRQWRRRWFVLALKQDRLAMQYFVEDSNETCAMRLKRSLLIDQQEAARREWASSRSHQAYLSIPVMGSKGRLVLASGTPGEADFLVESINAVNLNRGLSA